jgi:uncharacterized membrane protein
MARAVIGAGGALAALALVAGEAFAATSLSVAQASAGALSVLVALTVLIRLVNPSDLERANAVGAVTRVVGKTQAPVVEAVTNTVLTTSSVARAGIVTTSLRGGEERKQKSSRHKHFQL